MPFVRRSLIELRKELDLSREAFAREYTIVLRDLINSGRIEQRKKDCITGSTIDNWEKGKTIPGMDSLDVLCVMAGRAGYCNPFYVYNSGNIRIAIPDKWWYLDFKKSKG